MAKHNRIDAVVFDLDGVIYLGDFLLPGAVQTIRLLRRLGIGTYFVTNNATSTRQSLARHLGKMGLNCRTDEVINAAYSTASRLKRLYRKDDRMLVIGEKGLLLELTSAGFSPFRVRSKKDYELFRRRRSRVGAVVVSLDRNLTYWELAAGLQALTAGAELVACNLDSTWPVRGTVLPGTGSLVRLLEYASGQTARLIGKPDPAMFRLVLGEHRVPPSRTLVVGDRLEADIVAGKRLGARTALVLTGVTSRKALARSAIRPDFVLKRLKDLAAIPPIARLLRDGNA